MRFIIGFIFFGVLFYAISLYFPETFQTLVSWAAKTFNFIHDLFNQLSEKFSHTGTSTTSTGTVSK